MEKKTLKQQLVGFMNQALQTKPQASVFVDALQAVKAEDPTKVNWSLNEVLGEVPVVLSKWIEAHDEECAYRDYMDMAYKSSKKDAAVFEVANILSDLGYRG